eukprot:TRINITY_DN13788_c0_g3_i1.p1 TRINITY_DN13788_c0_g3~~TRINITY_DN13788_c0_g3_i1.p1  ORF type:complete len:106 (-),score=15.01 TRINITY_DN13788_c0_g3_i1:286-603(-)
MGSGRRSSFSGQVPAKMATGGSGFNAQKRPEIDPTQGRLLQLGSVTKPWTQPAASSTATARCGDASSSMRSTICMAHLDLTDLVLLQLLRSRVSDDLQQSACGAH